MQIRIILLLQFVYQYGFLILYIHSLDLQKLSISLDLLFYRYFWNLEKLIPVSIHQIVQFIVSFSIFIQFSSIFFNISQIYWVFFLFQYFCWCWCILLVFLLVYFVGVGVDVGAFVIFSQIFYVIVNIREFVSCLFVIFIL